MIVRASKTVVDVAVVAEMRARRMEMRRIRWREDGNGGGGVGGALAQHKLAGAVMQAD